MVHRNAVAIWSASYHDITGQAIVTRRVAEMVMPDLGPVRMCTFAPSGRPRALLSWLRAVVVLWGGIAARRVGMVYLVCSRSNAGFLRDVPALLAAKVGIKVVVHVHGSDIVSLLMARRIAPLARWLYRNCDVIVPSAHLEEAVARHCRQLWVCENFYSGPCQDQPPAQTVPTGRDLTVFWNSNIMASKGFFDVFEAVDSMHKRSVGIALVSIGAPRADHECDQMAVEARFNALGRPDWFTYCGPQPHTVAVQLLAQADVVLLPSQLEAQGVSVIEAMCAGKEVVVSDIQALRATVKGYPAYTVPVGSVAALVDALAAIGTNSRDPSRVAERDAAALTARVRFSTARFDRQMADLLALSPR